MKGSIYLIPTPLGEQNVPSVVTPGVLEAINQIEDYLVENERSARRALGRMGTQQPIQDLRFTLLESNPKPLVLESYLQPALEGRDVGVLSEAGCPGVADPGQAVVACAHRLGVRVISLVGPSSILLALMGSGLNGQEFSFHGYVPKDRNQRRSAIRSLEKLTKESGATQIVMDTPYRNQHLLEDLLELCQPETMLCIARELTLEGEFVCTKPIEDWRKEAPDVQKKPCLFLLGKNC